MDRTREARRLIDKHTCQCCGKKWIPGKRRFDIHHIEGVCGKKSRKYDSIKDLDKLLTLCHKCHYNRPDFSTKLKKYFLNHRKVKAGK